MPLPEIPFPHADGFGANPTITGGRGGAVYFVTNLNDSGAGSFRDAVDSTSTRIVMIMVNGTVDLLSECNIRDNKTILGQVSAGDGICFKKNRLRMFGYDNQIVRFIRSRLGDERGLNNESSPLFAIGSVGLIFDHCTFSWGTDQNMSFYKNRTVTMQYCIISEPLHNSINSKGPHGYNAIQGGKDVSVHHCLFAHATQRNPRFDAPSLYTEIGDIDNFRGVMDFRNNVVYNWKDVSAHGLEGGGVLNGQLNFINNYYKPGPASTSARVLMRFQKDDSNGWTYGQAYMNGNIMLGESDIIADNWVGALMEEGGSIDLSKVNTPFPANVYTLTQSAEDAYTTVLAHAGCSLVRDSVDTRIVSEVTAGNFTFNGSNGSVNGIIDAQSDVGGYPTLSGSTVQEAFDQLTAWLSANGYSSRPNVTDWTDSAQIDALGDYIADIDVTTGYSIAELYANDLVEHLYGPIEVIPPVQPRKKWAKKRPVL